MKTYFLIIYNILISAVVVFLFYRTESYTKEKTEFEEINVQRLNIVEPDGKIKMILTSKNKQPTDLILDGVKYDYGRGKSGGILTFNDKGEENGGYLFGGDSTEHGFNLSFDQYDSDQILALRSHEKFQNGVWKKLYGLALWERPDFITTKEVLDYENEIEKLNDSKEKEMRYRELEQKGIYGHNTIFVGRLYDKSYGLFINSVNSKSKIQFFIDSIGNPILKVLDRDGNHIKFSK